MAIPRRNSIEFARTRPDSYANMLIGTLEYDMLSRIDERETTDRVSGDMPPLDRLDERLRWLASWMIHNANHIRPNRDGLKVGGHQASCASISTLMTVLYFHTLRQQDRVAVKPHASPIFHAIQYIFGRQSRQQLEGDRKSVV